MYLERDWKKCTKFSEGNIIPKNMIIDIVDIWLYESGKK